MYKDVAAGSRPMLQSGTMFQNFLIVCTGNICRSPMAEALLAARLMPGRRFTVESAGIGVENGSPADPLAIELMQERGLDISGHRARPLTLELGRKFDLIFVMERGQKIWVEGRIPELRGRVYTLGHWSETIIPDPYLKPREHFEQALELIDTGVEEWTQCLL